MAGERIMTRERMRRGPAALLGPVSLRVTTPAP